MKTGSQEVSGSIPLISTKQKDTQRGVFFVCRGFCVSTGIAQQCAVRYEAPQGAEHDQREYPAYLHQKETDGKSRRFSFL